MTGVGEPNRLASYSGALLRDGGGPDQCHADDDGDGYFDEGRGETAEGGSACDLGGLVPVTAFDKSFTKEGEKAGTDAGPGDGADERQRDEDGARDRTDQGTDNGEEPRFTAATGLSGTDGGGEEFKDLAEDGDYHKGDKCCRVKHGLVGKNKLDRDGGNQHKPDPREGEEGQHHACGDGQKHDQDYENGFEHFFNKTGLGLAAYRSVVYICNAAQLQLLEWLSKFEADRKAGKVFGPWIYLTAKEMM